MESSRSRVDRARFNLFNSKRVLRSLLDGRRGVPRPNRPKLWSAELRPRHASFLKDTMVSSAQPCLSLTIRAELSEKEHIAHILKQASGVS
jgi:hypothetical protein